MGRKKKEKRWDYFILQKFPPISPAAQIGLWNVLLGAIGPFPQWQIQNKAPEMKGYHAFHWDRYKSVPATYFNLPRPCVSFSISKQSMASFSAGNVDPSLFTQLTISVYHWPQQRMLKIWELRPFLRGKSWSCWSSTCNWNEWLSPKIQTKKGKKKETKNYKTIYTLKRQQSTSLSYVGE